MARFPFSAIVGQDEMKQALLIAAVDPSVGGVMVFGDRGTGKSTAARALASLLPPIMAIANCPYGCSKEEQARYPGVVGDGPLKKRAVPFVDLPLGATEDRVIGSLDLERALRSGEKAFEPGLIGSGNPEEGELRPQLLDRFGLSVEVRTPKDLEVRIEIMRLVAANEADPAAFAERWAGEDEKILKKIARGKARLPKLVPGDDVLRDAANLCLAVGADGLSGELTLMRAARAYAALEGAKSVTRQHLIAIAPSALRHRLRRDVLDETGSTTRITRAIEELFG